MKRFNSLLFALLVSLSFSFMGTSCGGNTTTSTSIDSIAIEGPLEVGIREYIQLKATFQGDEQQVRWESSDKKIATVSSTGMVKGVSVGEVTIKATLISNENVYQDITIKVQESMQIGLVFNRFTDENSTYEVEGKGSVETTLGTKEMKFKEAHYKGSYLFTNMSSLMLPSYGIGEGKEGTYVYNLTNEDVTSAIYMRAYNTNYENVIVDMTDLSSVGISFSSIAKTENNIYEVNNTSFMGLMFYIWSQNININQTEYSSLQNDLADKMTGVTIHILTPYSFTCDLNFSEKVQNASLAFTKDETAKNNEKLQQYLKDNAISYPEVEADFVKAQKLCETHNYYRDLGNYTESMPIGKVYFTENAMYYDFNEDYIDETGQQDTLFDRGYINISGKEGYADGVYNFTYKRNAEGQQVFALGKQVTDKDYQGNSYLHYYDFIENISLVMQYLKNKDYTFTPTSTAEYGETYSQLYSDSEIAQSVAYSLFQDEIDALNAAIEITVKGFILAIHVDEEKAEDSVINYGFIMSAEGYNSYYYSKYKYTGFGTVTIPFVDEFLASL